MDKLLEVAAWQPGLGTKLYGQGLIRALRETGSTNDMAMALGLDGAPAGTLVIAGAQTRGRGRLGRRWHSPPGTGLYFSLVLRPELALRDLPLITLTAGVAACLAIEEETGLAAGIKWPNDLMLDGRKLGGILTETGPPAAGPLLVILGLGVNVLTPLAAFPDEVGERATSILAHSGRVFSRSRLLAALLRHLEAAVSELEEHGFAALLPEWQARDVLKDAHLAWLATDGRTVAGRSLGIDAQGRLRIRDDRGEVHEVLSGDLRICPGA